MRRSFFKIDGDFVAPDLRIGFKKPLGKRFGKELAIRLADNAFPQVSKETLIGAIGGAGGVAKAAVEAALARGAHVVTANKALLAVHGAQLATLAESNGAKLLFEAAVGGGVLVGVGPVATPRTITSSLKPESWVALPVSLKRRPKFGLLSAPCGSWNSKGLSRLFSSGSLLLICFSTTQALPSYQRACRFSLSLSRLCAPRPKATEMKR